MGRAQHGAREMRTAPKGGRVTNGNHITITHYAAISGIWAALWAVIALGAAL